MSATVYTTNLTKDECLQLLQKRAGRGGWVPWVEGTIAAKIRGNRFKVIAWGAANVRNSFAPSYFGCIEGGTGSTRISGRFKLHPIVRGFLVLWFGALAFGGGLMILLPSSAWGSGRPPSLFLVLAPVGMGLLGFAFVRFARRLARRQVESIRCFLRSELKAQPYVEGSRNKTLQATVATPRR